MERRSGDGHRSTHTLPAETRAGLHLDLARLRLRLLGKEDAQHAIAALRRDVSHLHRRGQRKSPGEAAVGPLDAVIPLLLVGVLELALAAQGQRVALELDVDIVGIDLRQLDLQRDAFAVLEDVDERRPAAAGAVGFFVGLLEVLVEQLVPHLLHRFTKRLSRFHPPCYLSDEWACPDREPIIGIPFYLADPKLTALEQAVNDIEDEREIMMYLRHEAGHAFNYAYELYATREWHERFGPFDRAYSDDYKPVPFSRGFVRHIAGWYAQKHPDEDFAETFAVWLTPRRNWRRRHPNSAP